MATTCLEGLLSTFCLLVSLTSGCRCLLLGDLERDAVLPLTGDFNGILSLGLLCTGTTSRDGLWPEDERDLERRITLTRFGDADRERRPICLP